MVTPQQPDPFRPHLVECRKLVEARKLDEAVAQIKAVLDVKADHPDANYLMGIAYAHKREPGTAIEFLERSQKVRPGIPLVMNELASLYEKCGRSADALPLLDQVLQKAPDFNTRVLLETRRGVALAKLDRYEEAATQFRKVAAEDPRHAPAWHNLGNVLARLGDHDGAVEAFSNAAKLDPENAFILYGLGRALLWQDRFEESIDYLSQAVARAPHELQMLSYKILALRHAGRNEEANDLEGIDDMIIAVRAAVPPGYGSMDEWNAALRDEIVNHPALTKDFKNRATRHGAKVDYMFARNKTPLFETILSIFNNITAPIPEPDGLFYFRVIIEHCFSHRRTNYCSIEFPAAVF